MSHPFKIKKHKLELVITFLLLFFYLGANLPGVVTKAWALFGFLTVPLLIIWNYKRFAWVAFRDIPMLLLIVAVPISVLWSVSPDATLAYSRAFLCSTAFGIFLATCYTPKELMQLLVWILGIFICLNFIFGIPSGTEVWRGITHHKNELSGAMSMAGTFFLTLSIYSSSRYRWIKLSLTGLAFLMLILSQGKGSLAIFVGLLPLLPLHKIAKQEYRLRTILLISALVIIAVIAVVTIVNLEFIVVDILGKNMGASSRDQVWTYLIERGLEKPWLGYGYAGFWNDPEEGLGVALEFPWIGGAGQGGGNAHSGYVETFLHLGWLGVTLVAISFLTVLTRVVLLHGLTRQIEYFWMIQFLLILACTGFYESYGSFLAYRHWFWVLYVSSAYSSAIHLNRIMKTGNKLVNIQAEKSFYSK
ncbi:MAG: O-antigen ligase family protein [Xenococcaceae cyanobacterium MO_188.B32]|nr:O-antigen ligase family protein [Xenococcaceae cyanobacterium MO_188.B32]